MLDFIPKILTGLFGSSANGKGVVGEISDAVDRWLPSDATKQKQSIENQKAGDDSQKNAYSLVLPSHDSWFDIFVDGLNRLPRPLLTLWLIGVLYNWWPTPNLELVHPIILNIMWTIITFWFGSRIVMKDVPAAIAVYNSIKKRRKQKVKVEKQVEEAMDDVIEDNDYDG